MGQLKNLIVFSRKTRSEFDPSDELLSQIHIPKDIFIK